MRMSGRAWLNRLLDVPATDPDDARRRKLLNTLLAFFAVTVIINGLTCQLIRAFRLPLHPPLYDPKFTVQISVCPPIVLVLCVLVFAVNRYGSSSLATLLFVLLIAVSLFSNTPDDWTLATLTYALTVPVFVASLLLGPHAGFVVAGLSSLTTSVVGALNAGIYVTPVFNFFGVAIWAWLMARNLQQAVHEARSEASKSMAILEGIADGVVVFDNDWRVTAVNPAMIALAGRSVEEIVGRDIEALMEAGGVDLGAEGWAAIRDMLSSGQRTRFGWGGKTLSANLSLVRDGSGEATGSVAVLRDVTREAEVERARESLFAVAAHELRTPLNAIINFANMMRVGVLPPDRLQGIAQRIAANGERLLILVNNLLERAKLEAREARPRVRPFALAELLDGVRDVVDVLAQEKDLELDVSVADDVPAVLLGDTRWLHQILVNLIGNGIKFTEQGVVRVRAYLLDADHPSAGSGPVWALEVADTGSGIPAEARSRIFEPFELAEDPATRKHAGAGLGLSIVKQMVELMGGTIALESRVGQGSTFTVVLPLAPEQEEEP